jgi:GT2 family glycosyltransferase
MKDLSIILVNWNSLDFTEQCIASIEANACGLDYEAIVVDNASADAPCSSLTARFPSVTLVLSESNLGFGRANNLAARRSSGRYLLFLNPDTVVLNDALPRMVDLLATNPQAGAVGCRLINADGTVQMSCVQNFPTVLNQLLALDFLKRRWPATPPWGIRALDVTLRKPVHEVEVVSGACILVRRQLFEWIGGFSPEYFMYAEEVELCHSIRRAGWSVLHAAEAQVTHFGGQSTKGREDDFAAIAMRDSVHRFLRRTRGNAYASLYRAGLLISAGCRLAALALVYPATMLPIPRLRRQQVSRIFVKWLRIARWCIAGTPGQPGLADTRAASALPGGP